MNAAEEIAERVMQECASLSDHEIVGLVRADLTAGRTYRARIAAQCITNPELRHIMYQTTLTHLKRVKP